MQPSAYKYRYFHSLQITSLILIVPISFESLSQHKLLQNMADSPGEEKRKGPLRSPNESFEEQTNNAELVTWALPYDPENPMQWSPRRRWAITWAMGGMTLVVSFASSVFSVATQATAEEFHVSTEVTTLGTSLYILV